MFQSKILQSQACSKNQGKTCYRNPDGANSRFWGGRDRPKGMVLKQPRDICSQGREGRKGPQRLPRIYFFCLLETEREKGCLAAA